MNTLLGRKYELICIDSWQECMDLREVKVRRIFMVLYKSDLIESI